MNMIEDQAPTPKASSRKTLSSPTQPRMTVKVPMKKKTDGVLRTPMKKKIPSLPASRETTSMETLLNRLEEGADRNGDSNISSNIDVDQRSQRSKQSQISRISQRSGRSQRSRNRTRRSSAASIDNRSVGSMSLSECLTAFKQHKQQSRRNHRNFITNTSLVDNAEEKDASSIADDMPSLVSYGQESMFSSMQSFNSSMDSAFTLSSTDISLISSATLGTITTINTYNTSASKPLQKPSAGGAAVAQIPVSLVSPRSSTIPDALISPLPTEESKTAGYDEELEKRPPPPPLPTKRNVAPQVPIQVTRIRRKGTTITQAHPKRSSQRSLLKSSAKNYTPDVVPLRESRWHTESVPIVQSGKAGRSRSTSTLSTVVPPTKSISQLSV